MLVSVLIGVIIVCAIVFLDMASKAIMMVLLDGGPITVIPEFFKLELTFNNGAAFSIFKGRFWLLMAITVVATLVFIYMARYANFKKCPWYSTGVYFMIGGMLGNFFERAFAPDRLGLSNAHGVTDFLSFTFFKTYDFAIFNVADSFLCIGVACVVIDIIFFESKRNKIKNDNND